MNATLNPVISTGVHSSHFLREINKYISLKTNQKSDMDFVKNTEEELHLEDEEKYRDFFNNANEAIIINDMEDRVIAWNPAAEKMFGWEAGEAIGNNPTELIVPPDKQEERYRIMRNALSGRKIDEVDTQRIRKDGNRINVSLTVFPLRDKKQNIIGLSYILKDITRG